MDQAEVVEDLPVERGEIVSSLEAGDGRHELLLPEEAHPDIVPQWRRLWDVLSSHSVLGQGHVVVLVSLHHGPGGQDGAAVLRVEGEGRAETLEGRLVVAGLYVEQPQRGVEDGALGEGLDGPCTRLQLPARPRS